MKYIIIITLLLLVLVATDAYACSVQTVTVNGQMQTWQVCCFPNGACQWTRIG